MKRMKSNMLSYLLCVVLLFGYSLGQDDVVFSKGQKFQIILMGTPDTSKMPLPPTDAPVWDIDLFDSDAATINTLKTAGKIVICYFSAGTLEDWRDDAKDFPTADAGKVLPEWPNEKWIRLGSAKIRDIMAKRIKLASDKGCDAIDPDNTDGYQNDNGLNLQPTDSISYMNFLQTNASAYGMKIGLKNSLDILDTVSPIIDFAVNEQCAQLGECATYNNFLASNKPVFHIEYPSPVYQPINSIYCSGSGTDGMSTVLKNITLDGLTVYCDGSQVDTPTKGGTSPPRPSRPPTPPRPTTSRPAPTLGTSSTSRYISTPRPTSSRTPPPTPRPSSTRTSAAAPTSTSGGGNGCKSKHWDQCGGQDWKGCTVCESPYRCQGVSPPYYYQCL